ncbi:hypothetical protein AURDEDRAFT_115589 [Auricularia subglabra TFB-10046 SS5]|nr:hypothetical protein AURDEDRAFT_115589 [Auricularia subglabra TFB-10046 SS5]
MYAPSISSIRPDKILVVKCKYERSLKKITFSSARNCTFHLLQTRVEQCFSLRASSYTIQYKDDDGEVAEISSDNDLTEAISYFHAPNEDTHSVRDSMSIRSFQSRSQRKITIFVDVIADYDGPSLSDTSSISGSESDDRPSSELSYGLSELARNPFGLRELEFDERTVSSRDRSAMSGPSAAAPSAISSRPARRLPPIPSALPSIQGSSNAGSSPSRSESPYGGDDDNSTRGLSVDADDPSAVFARIKLQETLQRGNNSDSDLLRPMPHLAWVEQQRGLTPAAIMNSRLRSSRSSGALSSAPSASSSRVDDSGSGKLALQQDLRGKYYYTYTSSEPAASQALSNRASSIGDSLIDELSLYMANNDDVVVRPERFSRSTDASDKRFSTSTGMSGASGLQRFDSVSSSRHTSLIAHMSINGLDHDHLHISPDIPPEVLKFVTDGPTLPPPPEEQTDCSSCGVMLDSFRYVCTTCGEKRPAGSSSGAPTTAGPSRSLTPQPLRLQVQTITNPFLTDEEAAQQKPQDYAYPPAMHRSPSSSSSTLADPFGQYPKPLPPPPVNVPGLLLPGSPTTMIGSPQTPTVFNGYELCVLCMEGAGVVHAMESTTALGVGAGNPYPSSPLSAASSLPASDDAMSELRRAAPSRKGQIRHAFVEKVWGVGGWKDVEQDDNVDSCSICSTSLAMRRYKCASCQNFNLCRACYSQVHEIHPSHAFLVVPEKQQVPRVQVNLNESLPKSKAPRASMLSMTSTIGEEESLTHPDVKCAHCMQDIVGARFHCAICDNIDICANCESAGLPGNLTSADGGHDYSHIMIKIPYPLNNKEVQTASQRALTLWTRRDSRHITRKSRSRSEYSSHARTVVGTPAPPMPDGASSIVLAANASSRSRPISTSTNASGGSVPMSMASSIEGGGRNGSSLGPLDHRTKCKHCRQPIVGVRYQCATCPSSPHAYSLCAACEPKSYFIHDGNHIFFKLPRPVERPIKSPFPFIPYLYRTPAGLFSDGTTDPANPEAYLLTLRHPTALCDWCMERIRGKWYRCAYCPKDLCADCEAIDSHDDSHLFVVFKSSVDMTQLRNFSDLEHPAPLIPYPVY